MRQIRFLILLILASAAFVLRAEEEMFEIGNFRYMKLTDSTVSVNTINDSDDTEARIPTEVTFEGKTYSVTRVLFFAAPKLEELVIPGCITEVGYNAFSRCYALRKVVLDYAEAPIDFLIGDNRSRNPFSAGPIEEVVINRDIVDSGHLSALFDSEKLEKVEIGDKVKIIPYYIFAYAKKLSDVTLGASLEYIGNSAFVGCESLKSIKFGKSLRHIGSLAFNQTGLEEVEVPANVTEIGRYFLAGAKSLRKVVIEDSDTPITYIDEYSGSWTDNCSLDSIYIGRNVPGYAFEKTPVKGIGIGAGVTAIDDCTFRGATGLKNLTVPGNVRSIGHEAFSGCSDLVELTLEDGIEKIGANTFYGIAISYLSLPSTLRTVDDYAFYELPNLESVTFRPGSGTVRFAGSNSFLSCQKLRRLTIGKSIGGFLTLDRVEKLDELVFDGQATKIPERMFYDLQSVGRLSIGAQVTDMENWFEWNLKVKDLDIADSDKPLRGTYMTVENNLYFGRNLDDEESYVLNYGENVKAEIGPMVTTIPNGFCYQNNMTELTIPENIRRINSYAFAYVRLTSLSIPPGVEYIGSHAFKECPLRELVFENGPEPLEIEYFPESKKVETLHVGRDIVGIDFLDAEENVLTLGTGITRISEREFCQNRNFSELTVPEGVTAIEASGLSNCSSMQTLRLPSTLLSLGEWALNGCKALTTVEIAATEPPSYRGSNTFPYPRIATLYVPLGCKEIYEEKWGIEFVAVVEKDFSGAGVPGMGEEGTHGICDVYTLEGMPVCRGVSAGGEEMRELRKGVYIVVPREGSPFRIVR